MKKEDEKYLFEKYPNLYRQHKLKPTETCMCWGFTCSSGWLKIIDELSKKITEIDPDVEAVQVKEKFGNLRFYIDGVKKENYEKVYDLINEAEIKSSKTCEHCGTEENVSKTKNGWIKTLCKNCIKIREDKNKNE
jgi:hypothetical protein